MSHFCNKLNFFNCWGIILKDTDYLTDSDEKYHEVWICNLVLTCGSGFSTLLVLQSGCGSSNDNKKDSFALLVQNAVFAVSIWCLYLWFDEIDLKDFKNESFGLYTLTAIRVYFAITAFSIVGLAILGPLIWIFISCCKNNRTDREPVYVEHNTNRQLNQV